jgi:hypothetical protein
MQYFQIKLHFSTKDQSHMYVLAGFCGMFTQLVLLRLLLVYMGKRNMLLVGAASQSLLQILSMFRAEWRFPPASYSHLMAA